MLFSCETAEFITPVENATPQTACRKGGQEAAARASASRRFQSSFRCGRPSVALCPGHAALDPVERLYARRRIDAFGGEVLDIDQIDPLRIGIILGAADGNRLDRLMAVGKLHLNETAGRLPFQSRHGLD